MSKPHQPTTAQEIFNTVALHLFTQGRPAKNDCRYCAYRAPDGTRCAVGVLIPDEYYLPDMEGRSVSSIRCQLPDHLLANYDLLLYLQDAHDDDHNHNSDGTFNFSALRKRLKIVAGICDLDDAVLDLV